jgi:hypothetical protein
MKLRKQTAVNNLINKLLPYIDRSKISDTMLQNIVEESIHEEKEQIKYSYYNGTTDEIKSYEELMLESEHFYNETYGK